MTAAKYDFTIDQGSSFSRVLTFESDYTMPSFARLVAASSTATVLDIDTTDTVNFLSLNTSAKTVTILLVPTYTALLDFNTADYQLEFTFASGSKDRILEGVITLSNQY